MLGIKLIFISAILLICYGCAGMDPNAPYQPVAMDVAAVREEKPDISKVTPTQGPIDLQQAIDIALSNNPDIAATSFDAAASQAELDFAKAEQLPIFGIAGGYIHHLDEQRLLPVRQPGDPAVLSRDIISGDFVITMPLLTGGRLVNQVKAAELLQNAANHLLARSREELVFNVSSMFFSILAQQRVVESLEFSGKVLHEHLKHVDDLVNAQKAAEVDRLRTNVRLADIEQRLVQEKNILAIQHRAWLNLLGLENHDETLFPQGELTSEHEGLNTNLESALQLALNKRADYLAARSSLEAQARKVDTAMAGHRPTVYLQSSYGERWAVGPTSGSGNETDDIGRIGLVAEIPIYDGGRVSAKVAEQRAKLSAARERLRKLELQIRLDVETAMLNIGSSLERIEAVQKAVEQADESLRIEREKYDLGKGAIIDVLDAQAALLESQTNYFRTLADYNVSLAQWRLATGEKI
ncbi:MAG: TolC family protein [Sedimentisphaerales bacterium]|nr:TolC family protein [Sedimentisphaerales bacterium]